MPGSDESIKLLLKQVYTLHNSRVKELENTVKDLKEKLLEKDRQLSDAQLNCKKCCELEEAIKSCKAALYEQSKLFENLGEKFSVFDSLEKEQLRNPADTSKSSTIDVKETISHLSVKVESNFDVEKTFEEKSYQSLCFTDAVSNVTTKKQNLLQNVMIDSLEESSCSGSMKNPSTLMPNDSLILAPDTLDIDTNTKTKYSKNIIKQEKILKKPDSDVNKYFKEQNSFIESTKNSESDKPGKKRLSSESSCMDNSSKKCKMESDLLTKSNDNECFKTLLPKDSIKDLSSYNLRNRANPLISEEKAETKISNRKLDAKKVIPPETTMIPDENMSSRNFKNSKSLEDSTFRILNCAKENVNQASPSLLPLNTNHNNINEAPDSDDFQPSNGKYKENNSLKEINDRKKLAKKVQSAKPIKTSSKFKMTLDAPPLDYKKPNYRQTKLSKTIFQPHVKNTTLQTPVRKKEINAKNREEGNVTSPTRSKAQDFFLSDKQESKTVDFDATCIPENFKFEFTPCGKFSSNQIEQNKLTMSFDESILMLDDTSENKVLKLPCEYDTLKRSPKSAQKSEKNTDSSSEDKSSDAKENMNSFDRLPLPEEPKYKYKEETVRKKADRRQLAGYECKDCEKYYSDLGLSDKEKQQRLKKCSRHRAKFVPPSTPEHFWELDFPDTQECKARGYLNETQKMKLNFLTS